MADTIGGSYRNGAVDRESDRSAGQSRLIFGRSLSNESEPYDEPYESKELRAHSDVTSKLIRTISEESLPREMLEGVDEEVIIDFFDEGLMKDATNNSVSDGHTDQQVRTPPPSPEPKIKAQIQDNDHSTLLKVLNDEVAADESNLSSMTPSLTELEVALSDMLEKEDHPDENAKRANTNDCKQSNYFAEGLLEPRIVPVEKRDAVDDTANRATSSNALLVDDTLERKTDQSSISLEQILGGSEPTPKTRKVSFCAWEENIMTEVDLKSNEEPEGIGKSTHDATASTVSKNSVVTRELGSSYDFFENLEDVQVNVKDNAKPGEAPDKPDRLFQNAYDADETSRKIPTPPRRRNRSSGILKEPVRIVESHHDEAEPYSNDRLI